ncbi:DExH-box ATP-dependent RNA helicase DExH8-like, partial [Phalaenopsis equestris]|uniref:DExH-box ATP-dependent RNA helicase DExH8-like n=1 Tax=Phalaenopsis equestris TaxID=78828 RepID=UPI0009E5560D
DEGESIYRASERFKELPRKCLYHVLPNCSLMSKPFDETYSLIEEMATNNFQGPSKRVNPIKIASVHDNNVLSALTSQGCRYGNSCFFLHDYGSRILSATPPNSCFQEDEVTTGYSFLQLLPSTVDGCVLVLNDKNLHFTPNLSQCLSPKKIYATTRHQDSSCINAFPTGVRVLWNVIRPSQIIIGAKGDTFIPWKEIHSVLWFVDYEAEHSDILELQNFLEFLAVRILADSLTKLRPIIIMNNIRFAQCQVERLARDCFFFLTESAPFDEANFGSFSDSCGIARPMQVCRPICYAFEMVPPTDIQFGDYAAALHMGLHNI